MSVQTISVAPRRTGGMSARTRDRLLNVISPLGLLLVWELCARFGFIDTRFFPAPSSVLSTLVEMLGTGELVADTAISLQRLAYGTVVGALPALVLGIVMGLNRPIRALCDPIIAATYPVPKSAILPLALLISPLYAYPWILAAIIAVTNAGQGIAALVLVLVPTESVPPQFAATAIGLTTLVSEIAGATIAPVIAGAVAQTHGLAATLWMSAGGAGLVFAAALFLKETYQAKAPHPVLREALAD